MVTAPCEAQVASFSIADIGSPGATGSYSFAAGTYTVSGAGTGIGGSSDSFSFASTTATNNTEMICRVASQAGSPLNNYAPAGLMIRAIPNADFPNAAQQVMAFVSVSPRNGVNFTTRPVYGSPSTTMLGPSIASPTWLRLVLSQTSVAAYYSSDGLTWTLVGKTTMDVPAVYQEGFAVSSNQAGTLSTATYTNVSFLTNVPQITASNMVLWLRDDVGVQHSGTALTSWLDQSGSGNNFSQATATARPTIVANQVNGLSSINFSGTQWLQAAAGFSNFGQGASIFIVTQPNTESAGTYRLLWFGKTGTVNDQIAIDQTSSTGWRNYVYSGATSSSATATSGLSTTAFQALETIYDAISTSTLFNNGTQVGQNTAMQIAQNVLRTANNIGSYNNGASQLFKGNIAEIIVFNTALSPIQRQGVETYLFGKFALNGSPPTLAAPAITPQYALVDSPQGVSINPPAGSVAYYSLNGGPTTLYTGPFTVNSTTTISATSVAPGFQTSPATPGEILFDSIAPLVKQSAPRLWLRSDVGLPSTGAAATWFDVSGNNLNAIQPTTTKQPTVMANQINGLPAVTFDGSNDSLTIAQDPSFADLSKGASMFIVTKPVNHSGTFALLWFGLTGTYSDEVSLCQTSPTNCRGYIYNASTSSSVLASPGLITTNYQVLEESYDGATTASLFNNGALVGQNTAMQSANNIARFGTVGAYSSGAGQLFSGSIAEIIFFNKALPTAQRQAIERYLQVRYGLNIAAPVISPSSGFYGTTQAIVTITGDPGTQQYYSIDGQIPVVGHSDTFLYTTPFSVTNPTNVQAISVAPSLTSSLASSFIVIDDRASNVPTTNLISWLRSDLFVTSSGANVSGWHDMSGTSDATQSIASQQPQLVSNAINGYPAINFTASNQTCLPFNVSSTYPPLYLGSSLFVVLKPNTVGAGALSTCLSYSYFAGTDKNTLGLVNNANPNLDLRLTAASGYAQAANLGVVGRPLLLESVTQAGNASGFLYRNGQLTASASTSNMNNPANLAAVGYDVGSGAQYFNGQIAEILCYAPPLSVAQKTSVEAYLMERYGLIASNTPVFSIASGTTLSAPAQVAISAPDGSTIYYSTTGPATTSSAIYTGPITVSYSQTLYALELAPKN